MVGMGATLTPQAFRDVAKSPRGVILGLCSQFGWMPLVAFGLGVGLSLPPTMALGLLLVGCTPGGTTSNLFTYLSRADVALSISMTVISTLAAVVLMPLLIGLYAQGLEGLAFEVPLGSIATTLVLVLVPVAIGMAVRHRSEKAAKRVERFGSISGVLVLVVLVSSALYHNHALFLSIPLSGYAAALLLGVVGMVLGYGGGTLLGLEMPKRVAVSLETGIQNTPLAFAVIIATLPDDEIDKTLELPILYALFILISASAASMIFRKLSAPAEPTEQSPTS